MLKENMIVPCEQRLSINMSSNDERFTNIVPKLASYRSIVSCDLSNWEL